MTVNTATMEKAPLLLKDSSKSSNKATKSIIEHTVVLIAQPRLIVDNTQKTPKTLENGRSIRRMDYDKCSRICMIILLGVMGCGLIGGIVSILVFGHPGAGDYYHPNVCKNVKLLSQQLVNGSSIFLQNTLEGELAKHSIKLPIQSFITSYGQSFGSSIVDAYRGCPVNTDPDWDWDCHMLDLYYLHALSSAKPLFIQSISTVFVAANITLSPAEQTQLINSQMKNLCELENVVSDNSPIPCLYGDFCDWL